MIIYVVGEPLEVYESKEAALQTLRRCLQGELPYIQNYDERWVLKRALDSGEILMALRLWQRFQTDRPRLRFEELEIK